jgi:hypothetical protein
MVRENGNMDSIEKTRSSNVKFFNRVCLVCLLCDASYDSVGALEKPEIHKRGAYTNICIVDTLHIIYL